MPSGMEWQAEPGNGDGIMKIKNSSSFALISYISRCYHDGDKAALDVLNIDLGQARRISRLSAFESNTLSGIAGRFTIFRLQFRSLEKCYRLVVEDPVSLSGSRSKTKEVDLCLHVFNHIITLYRRSEQQALAEIGLEPEQAEFISLRPWVELQKLARYLWFFTTVEIDNKLLEQSIDTAIASARWIGQCAELIRAGAPRDLMTRYYGMSCELYAAAREMHGRQCRGRPRVLSEDLQYLLYEEFVRRYQSYDEGVDPLCQPGFFLAIYESLERKVSLREIWILIQEWLNGKRELRRFADVPVKGSAPVQDVGFSTPRTAPRLRNRSKTSRPPSTTASEVSRSSSAAILSRCDRAGVPG